jgi:hypothetical protein
MFVLAFHERDSRNQCWSSAPIPLQAPSYKEGRLVLNADLSGDISKNRIPSTGRLDVVGAAGAIVHTLDYSIPSAARVTDCDREHSLGEFPGYEDLPEEKWFQLNPPTDPYTVQIKAKKMRPVDACRSFNRGEYFVYTPVRIVLRPPARSESEHRQASPTSLALATLLGTAPGPKAFAPPGRTDRADIELLKDL